MNTTIEDEIISINSIYGSGTLVQEPPPSNVIVLHLAKVDCAIRLSFPVAYPDDPPSVLGPASAGSAIRKGMASEVATLAHDALSDCFTPGVPCIFDLVELISSKMPEEKVQLEKQYVREQQGYTAQSLNPESSSHSALHNVSPTWVLSDVITEKKSVFVGRATRVKSPEEARFFLAQLMATDKKAAKATHNITAWRIKGSAEIVYQDCDDDGEAAAGGRLLHLLQMMGVWDVFVVVSRWYGGIKLGPDRFRLINTAARDCLTKGGLVEEAHN